MDRRAFLAAVGAATGTVLAGCGGTGGGGPSGTPSGGQTTLKESATDGTGGLDHPAAVGLADQPQVGEGGRHTIVAFEDPSCTRCAAFERQVVPKIRSNLVEGGSTRLVVRTYPVIYPWGKPATQALEATYARDSDAFWPLWHHYFENQSAFTSENVLDRTATFLDGETDLDGAAVAEDARQKAYDAAVQADLDAGEAAGAGGITPSIYLFRDGEYVTMAQASISYNIVATALGEN